uniref:Uncharacterized protein n=1 Tax=Arundo donax TaxID=35708 RepID=A0A0A9DPL9_ARUDO
MLPEQTTTFTNISSNDLLNLGKCILQGGFLVCLSEIQKIQNSEALTVPS